MKKIGVFLLTLASCFALASCGSKKTAAPTTAAPNTTAAPTPGTQTYTSKSQTEVMEALGDKYVFGANIPYVDEDSGEVTHMDVTLAVDKTGVVDKIAMLSPMGGIYLKGFNTDEYLFYEYDETMDAYNYLSVDSREETDEIVDAEINMALSIACGLTIKYTSKNDFNFLNRQCTQYLNTYTSGSAEINEEYMIDNATGICLSHTKVSSAKPGEYINDATTFTVSEFGLTTDVDSCFATQESRILVESWDTDFYNGHGLTDKTGYYVDIADIAGHYTGTEVNYKLDYAFSGFDDGHQYCNTTSYILESTDTNAKDNFAGYIIENIYNCGAKYDALGYERVLNALVNGYSFNAYSNQIANYSVTITYEPGTKARLTMTLTNDFYVPQKTARIYQQYSLEKILVTIKNGYMMDVKIPDYDSTDQTYSLETSFLAYNGNIIIRDEEGTMYFKEKDSETYYWYVFDETTEYYYPYSVVNPSASDEITKEDLKANIIDIEAELSIACGKIISYTSKESVTYAGRTCTKLTYENTIPGGATTIEEYIIDNNTGLCLSHTKTSSAQTDPIIDQTTFAVLNISLNEGTETPVTEFFTAENNKIYS